MDINAKTILLAEDDALLREGITDYFTSKGWHIDAVSNGVDVLSQLKNRSYALILLDIMMPGLDGFQICRKIRQSGTSYAEIPIIFITARAMEEDELNGYAIGADDYVTKPFSLPVLHAKVQAVVKRIPQTKHHQICIGTIVVDESIKQVFNDGVSCNLPPLEYEMLLFFMKHPEQIFSRDQLVIRFWGYDFDGNPRVVDNHIKKLRKALGQNGDLIQTARKSGYWMKRS